MGNRTEAKKRADRKYYETNKEKIKSYYKTEQGVTKTIYGQQRNSSKKRGHPTPPYTLQEFRAWIYSQKKWDSLYNTWVESGYNTLMKPSVDRINSTLPYTFDNLQLMTWGQNNYKGISERTGSKHGNAKPKSYYSINPVRRFSFKTTCKNMKWQFDSFREIDSGKKAKSGHKEYYYKEMVT